MLSLLPRSGAKVGLLGGSFNPAHEGHRHISMLALKRLKLHRVWWLVSPQNPLKARSGMAPLTARCLNAVDVAGHSHIDVTSVESELRTNYTVDTIRRLQSRGSHINFVWLMGADNLAEIAQWKAWRLLFKSVPIAVFDRPDFARDALSSEASKTFARDRLSDRKLAKLPTSAPPSWVFVRSELHPASATSIRSKGLWKWH